MDDMISIGESQGEEISLKPIETSQASTVDIHEDLVTMNENINLLLGWQIQLTCVVIGLLIALLIARGVKHDNN